MKQETHSHERTKDPSLAPYLRSVGVEVLVYTPLLVIYLYLVIRFATGPLVRLFYSSPAVYSAISISIIFAQGVFLEMLTSWLLRRFGVRL